MSKKGNDFDKNRELFEAGMSGISDRFIKEAADPKAGRVGIVRRTFSGGTLKTLVAAAALLVALVVVVMSIPVFNTFFKGAPGVPVEPAENVPGLNEADNDSKNAKDGKDNRDDADVDPAEPLTPAPDETYSVASEILVPMNIVLPACSSPDGRHHFVAKGKTPPSCVSYCTDLRCTYCGLEAYASVTATEEHHFVDGICSACGTPEWKAGSDILDHPETYDITVMDAMLLGPQEWFMGFESRLNDFVKDPCVSPDGHDFAIPKVDKPSCVECWVKAKCQRCGLRVSFGYSATEPHVYSDGRCVNCGAEEGPTDPIILEFDYEKIVIVYEAFGNHCEVYSKLAEVGVDYDQYPESELQSIKNVKIKATFNGLPVTRIEEGAFAGTGIVSLTVEGNSLIEIGRGAFDNCECLKTVTLPDSVKSIEDHAFSGCGNLGGMKLPASLEKLGIKAFAECIGLRWVSVPVGVKEIPYACFYYCGLEKVSMTAVREIGEIAFSDCLYLEEIEFPLTLKEIGPNAFINCWNLENVINLGGDVKVDPTAFLNTMIGGTTTFEDSMSGFIPEFTGDKVFTLRDLMKYADENHGGASVTKRWFEVWDAAGANSQYIDWKVLCSNDFLLYSPDYSGLAAEAFASSPSDKIEGYLVEYVSIRNSDDFVEYTVCCLVPIPDGSTPGAIIGPSLALIKELELEVYKKVLTGEIGLEHLWDYGLDKYLLTSYDPSAVIISVESGSATYSTGIGSREYGKLLANSIAIKNADVLKINVEVSDDTDYAPDTTVSYPEPMTEPVEDVLYPELPTEPVEDVH